MPERNRLIRVVRLTEDRLTEDRFASGAAAIGGEC